MKKVASLRYGVVFKKAFCDVEVFTAFVKDFLNIDLVIDKVETEKSFNPLIGDVDSHFDLYAEDKQNHVIVDIQHCHYDDYYDRFLYYHCAALLEQITNSHSYKPDLKVFTIVVLTKNNPHKSAISTIDFDPIDFVEQQGLKEIPHKIVYLSPKHVSDKIPAPYFEWLSAIKDSLDEEVDETIYQHPAILKVFSLIERDNLTSKDRARIKEEKAVEDAISSVKLDIAQKMKAEGMCLEIIEQVTGLENTFLEKLFSKNE